MGLYFWVRDILSHPAEGAVQRVLLAPLGALAWLYSRLLGARRWAYRHRLLPALRVPVPVISVGNITAGGTGKTPCVQRLCRILLESGRRPAILARGYGGAFRGDWAAVSDGQQVRLGAEEAGDEPVMLARSLPGVPVLIGVDRRRSAKAALERFSADVLVLDDGFQHLRLQRDLDILTVDARNPLGNGYCLPRGLLREGPGALADADLVLLTHTQRLEERKVTAVRQRLQRHHPGCACLDTRHTALDLWDLNTGRAAPVADAIGSKVLAFAGIGNPDGFFQDLRDLGLQVLESVPFPDHHAFTDADLRQLESWARLMNAQAMVTTEKDAVRLAGRLPEGIRVLALRIQLEVDGDETLVAALQRALARYPHAPVPRDEEEST